ncbi:MAG TPA: restriction endonuclease subunit S, partial [Anaerolineaceae bacterium]|nr:restriction endonuclease subunit S [Anaerolineaceae bacterium]
GSNLHAHDYRAVGIPLILVKHIINGQIDDENLDLVGEHKWAELQAYRLQEGDIVVTRVGRVGDSAYVFEQNSGWFFSGQTLRVRLPINDRLHPRFLAYYYHLSQFNRQLEQFATGATRLSLNTELLASFKILVPEYSVQLKYVELIKPIDSIILTIKKQNRNLRQQRDLLLPRLISGELDVEALEIPTL